MNAVNPATLEPVGNGQIVLESVHVEASLSGLFSTVTLTQAYRNSEDINIEAVYTFPLPLDAVLMELVVEINGQTLRGVVRRKQQAEEQYEDALEEGHSAVLLQQVQPGLYNVNVGNIMPDERVVVRYRYAQLHHWQGDSLRFHLPTTIAPRYGDPEAAGLQPHQTPAYTLTANHGFSLKVALHGPLATADFECPTHMVRVATLEGVKTITLSGGSALMNRDFALIIRQPETGEMEALCAPDGDNHVLLAPFHPRAPQNTHVSPRCFKLVVDCSGSMNGTAITQARDALEEILDLLDPMDTFNLFTFGTEYKQLFPRPVPASGEYLAMARQMVAYLEANMGGTNMAQVLEAACKSDQIDGPPTDILLITDGQVWDEGRIIKNVENAGHRIFTVGVGSSVSESLVRRLAEATSGACEQVSLLENMAEKIVRHFRRMRQPRAESVHIHWPGQPECQWPAAITGLFAGDTLHAFAWFEQAPTGQVGLEITYEGGTTIRHTIGIRKPDHPTQPWQADLPRVAAHSRLPELDEQQAATLAERYQLVTPYTSCILVAEREEGKADEIPALRKVPHLLPDEAYASVRMSCQHESVADFDDSGCAHLSDPDVCDFAVDEMDLTSREPKPLPLNLDELVDNLNARYPESQAARLAITTIDELRELGLPNILRVSFVMLSKIGHEEKHIVIAFLWQLAESHYGQGLSRHVKRLIRQAANSNTAYSTLTPFMRSILGLDAP